MDSELVLGKSLNQRNENRDFPLYTGEKERGHRDEKWQVQDSELQACHQACSLAVSWQQDDAVTKTKASLYHHSTYPPNKPLGLHTINY